MRTVHITKMLEQMPVSRLSEGELAIIEAHAADCSECLRAYGAARLAESLIRSRASETIVVPPFFNTRVTAAISERRLSAGLPTIMKWWQAARAIISAATAMIVVLIGLTIFTNGPQQAILPEPAISQSIFSPEYVVLDEDDPADNIGYDQALGVMYDPEGDDGN